VAPLTAASHILPGRKVWALGEKPLCGRSPTDSLKILLVDYERRAQFQKELDSIKKIIKAKHKRGA
jgi:hypothetical protein